MKNCPYCDEQIQDDATKCRYCGEWLVREKKAPVSLGSLKFPKIWPGYIIALLFLVVDAFIIIAPTEQEGNLIALWALPLSIIAIIYWCVCLYRIHKAVIVMADNCYPISPARAVGFGFIPIYNLYWMFKWPSELLNFVKTRSSIETVRPWVIGLLLLLSGLIASRIDGALWTAIDFGVLSYVIGALKKSLTVKPEPAPYKSKQTLSGGIVAAIVFACSIPIIALLAAIAIPNLIRAREVAQHNACTNVMRMIDVAKHQWMLDNNKTETDTPTIAEINLYIKSGLPSCSAGGTYTIGEVDVLPSCSIHGSLSGSYSD